jgi:LPS export ABC transporter protein LptC
MNRIPKAVWPIAGILLLLAIGALFVFRVPQLVMVSSKVSRLASGESLKMSDITFSQDYKGGRGKWELNAKEAHFFDKDQLLTLRGVSLRLDSSPKACFTIKGNEGDYCRETGKITLRGEVTGRSSDGYQLQTSVLIFREKDGLVETDEPVRVTGPFFQIEGDGLRADLTEKIFTVKENVCTTVNARDVL